MKIKNNNEQEVEQFIQGRQRLYQSLGLRKDALMNLLDAISSNRDANTVVKLSLNPLFKLKYQSIYRAIADFSKAGKKKSKIQNKAEIFNLILESIPENNQRKFHLFGLDVTPNSRQFSPTVSDKSFIHQPNSIKGNKPINIGHAYSWLCYLPEKVPNCDASWTIPLSVERVSSEEKDVSVAHKQINKVFTDSLLFKAILSVIVVDCLYSQKDFIGKQVLNQDRVVVTRVRSNRIFYRPFVRDSSELKSGHPRWYGDKFELKDSTSWHPPDDLIQTNLTTKRGKLLNVKIKGWNNMLMRGTKEHKLHDYPFTLLQITITDQEGNSVWKPMWLIAIGKRRQDLTLLEIYQSYRQRFDLEHFFRFGKQRLLMNDYLTSDTSYEENWMNLILIAYIQLWNARNLAVCLPRPWEKYLPNFREGKITPSAVQRDFSRIISTIGINSHSPKPRGFSSGRKKGEIQVKRPRYQVIKKNQKCQQNS